MFVSCWLSTTRLQNNGEISNFLGNLLIPNWHYWREHPVLWASRWALVHWQQHPRRGLWRSGIVCGAWTAVWSWRGSSPSIAVLVELQETLFMLGGGRYCLQSAFLICPWESFEILVLGVFHQKGFLIFDFFRPSYNVFNDTNSGVWAKLNQRNCAY